MKRSLAVLLAIVLVVWPICAVAATATPVPPSTASGLQSPSRLVTDVPGVPVTPANMQVLLWTSASGAEVIVAVDVAPTVPLPATVRIPLPVGATVEWAGELSGGAVETDIQRDYAIEEGTGGKVVVMRLEKYHSAQIEVTHASPQLIGDRTVSTLDWVQSAEASETDFAVQVGPEASDVAIDPVGLGAPQTNSAGERLYSVATKSLKPGQRFTVTVAYGSAGVTSGPAATGGGNTVLLTVLGVLLAAAVIAFIVVAARMRGIRGVDGPERPDEASDRARTSPPQAGEAATGEPDEDDPFRVDWE